MTAVLSTCKSASTMSTSTSSMALACPTLLPPPPQGGRPHRARGSAQGAAVRPRWSGGTILLPRGASLLLPHAILPPLLLLRSSLPPGSPPPSHGGALGGAGRLVGGAGRGHGGHRVKAVRQLAPGHLHLEELDHNHKARLLQLSTSNI